VFQPTPSRALTAYVRFIAHAFLVAGRRAKYFDVMLVTTCALAGDVIRQRSAGLNNFENQLFEGGSFQ
jgi:hypothetical protein